jgi:hypothetical protein
MTKTTKNYEEMTRDEKDDVLTARVEFVLGAVAPKLEEEEASNEQVLEALLYAAHYVMVSGGTGNDIYDTLSALNRLAINGTVDRAVEKATLVEVEEEVRPEVSE